jgi:hypothetical protein
MSQHDQARTARASKIAEAILAGLKQTNSPDNRAVIHAALADKGFLVVPSQMLATLYDYIAEGEGRGPIRMIEALELLAPYRPEKER